MRSVKEFDLLDLSVASRDPGRANRVPAIRGGKLDGPVSTSMQGKYRNRVQSQVDIILWCDNGKVLVGAETVFIPGHGSRYKN